MTPRNALLAVHLGALLFGLTGVFGKLCAATWGYLTANGDLGE